MAHDGIFVTGTDTGVGKTFVSALLVRALLDRGIDATYIKSAATGVTGDEAEDVSFVARFSGLQGDLSQMCPIRLKTPASPYAAACMENAHINIEDILQAVQKARAAHQFVVIEGVGGLLVPITKDYLVSDLIADLAAPVVVVSRPGLGAINHSLLTLDKLHNSGADVFGFLTCGPSDNSDPSIPSNPAIIKEFSHTPFLGNIPSCDNIERDFHLWTRYVDKAVAVMGFQAPAQRPNG